MDNPAAMPFPPEDRRVIRFGVFELDVRSGELRKQGLKTRLPPQSFHALLMLLEARGGVVTRDALRRKLWPVDTSVNLDMGLGSAMKKLRDALGDSAGKPRFVETLPRRGYRFIAAINPPLRADPEASAPPPPALPAAPSRRRPLTLVAAGLLGIALVALAAGGRSLFRTSRAAPIQIQSVAVLPLENLSGDRAQDYFADGMTDALITKLAQIRGLRVISRTSVMPYRGTDKPVGAIARELGVDALVEGTVVRVGERVRVTAQLIHAPTDRHLWARSYDRELRDVLALQSEIAAAVAQAVESEIRPGERGASRTTSRRSAPLAPAGDHHPGAGQDEHAAHDGGNRLSSRRIHAEGDASDLDAGSLLVRDRDEQRRDAEDQDREADDEEGFHGFTSATSATNQPPRGV
jgi:TolB-like protein/DNA-binding winged helix-turn-helix (wHTH) protein